MNSQAMKIIKNERGIITLDFVFALFITFGFALVFMAMSYTLAMVEVTQYVTYATSRAYNAAHNAESDQHDAAVAKFQELKTHGVLKSLYSNGWTVLGAPQIQDFHDDYPNDDASPGTNRLQFIGVRVPFQSKVLDLRLPLLGRTSPNQTAGVATLNSYLSREISTTECETQFVEKRWSKIQQKGGFLGTADSYRPMSDNGC